MLVSRWRIAVDGGAYEEGGCGNADTDCESGGHDVDAVLVVKMP